MYRLSFGDLLWESVLLQPQRYTIDCGKNTPLKSPGKTDDIIRILPDRHTAFIGMPAGKGKISDAGYDQMACLVTKLPVCDHVVFRGNICVLACPSAEEQNGQEGLGLFIRDTMTLDSLTGYPYSNMAAAGIFGGNPGLIGRQGITWNSIEQIRNTVRMDHLKSHHSLTGKKLEVILEKNGPRLTASVAAEGESPRSEYDFTVDADLFSSREPDSFYLGFMAARGCSMEVYLNSVSIEYDYLSESDKSQPVLYVSPDGGPLGQGTHEAPLDLQSAVNQCRKGQEIRVMPGHYRMAEDLIIPFSSSGSGQYFRKITAENSTGERVVLDFGGKEHGFIINGNNWDISGLTVTRGFGFMVRGSRNRIRNCLAVSNLETGFLIRHPANDGSEEYWPSYNEICDCISCLNRDISEQHADGFACKIAAGPGNRFIRCTSWMNSDDGFDLFSKNRQTGPVRLVECRSWLNGYRIEDGHPVRTAGNGNGFKLGGSGMAADHEAVYCEAVGNRGFGFTSNSNPHMRLSGCRACNNGRNYVYYYTGSDSQPVYITDNCTQTDDPDFDPAVWAHEHILYPCSDLRSFSADDGRLLVEYSIREHNDAIVRDSLSAASSRICFKNNGKPALLIMCSSMYGGGAERVACRLANGLSEHFNVYYLYIRDKGRSYILDSGIKAIAMPFFNGDFETIMDCRAAFAAGLKEMLDISVTISFMLTMNKLNVRSAGKGKVICSERNNPSKRDPEHLKEIEAIYEAADFVVFQSDTVRDLFSHKVREHSSIILNPVGVSCQRIGGSHRIINVGRLTLQKNQAMLIRAFSVFSQSHPEYTLSFYGDGELADDLQTLAISLGLKDVVQFHGNVPDVHSAISDAEIFVLSSDYEGLSNSLLECMMMGFPCVSTRCEGSVDVIQSGANGILVDIGNVEQMAAALSLLADDADLRTILGIRARETSERFRSDIILNQWERLIERLEIV